MNFNTLNDFENFLTTKSLVSADWIYLQSEKKYRFTKDLNITIEILDQDLGIKKDDLQNHPFAQIVKNLLDDKCHKIVKNIDKITILIRQNNNLIIDFDGYYFEYSTISKPEEKFTIILPTTQKLQPITFHGIRKAIVNALNHQLTHVRLISSIE